jgi:hypothetical protein
MASTRKGHSSARSVRFAVSTSLESTKQYSYVAQRYSQRSKETSLYCGSHYRQLAQFLTSSTPTEALELYRPEGESFAFVNVLAFGTENTTRTVYYDGLNGLKKFALTPPIPEPDTGQILFIRGYPSPE